MPKRARVGWGGCSVPFCEILATLLTDNFEQKALSSDHVIAVMGTRAVMRMMTAVTEELAMAEDVCLVDIDHL